MKKELKDIVEERIKRLDEHRGNGYEKAILSKLRRSMGRPIQETVDIWSFLFDKLPENFLGNGEEESKEERAILAILQFYAMYQQGNEESVVYQKGEEKYDYNIGDSLRVLREGEATTGIDRRFNRMITSGSWEELIQHLRHLIKLLKAKEKQRKIDFSKLASDLYWFQMGCEEQIKLSWGRAFYRTIEKENENERK